jgi:undecaprenyl-phosphate 4-deoxy-4-formamido-L-arabinose transferase
MTEKIDLSVVVPVYNEKDNIEELYSRLTRVLQNLNRPYEVIFVNDGSRDGSDQMLKDIAQKDEHIIVVEFNRNYGQHQAVFAGFENASGDVIVTIDADLQNPPEEIPNLLEKSDKGYEVVFTIRKGRRDSLFRRFASYIRNIVAAKTTGVKLTDYGSMLAAYKKEIVHAMCASEEISTYIPILSTRYANPDRVAEVSVQHAARTRGESKYNLMKLIMLEFDLITSFSIWPLRLMMLLGIIISFCGISFGMFLLVMRLIMGSEWAAYGVFTLFAVLFVLVGAQFFAFGLLGEYIGRIYSEVRKRPRFIIKNIYSRKAKKE